MIRQLLAGKTQRVLKYMERCLTSLVIRKCIFKQLSHHRQKLGSQKISCTGKGIRKTQAPGVNENGHSQYEEQSDSV